MDGQTQQITRLEEQVKTLFKQQEAQNKLIDSVHALALSVQDLAGKQERTGQDVDGLRRDVDEIKAKPARRWDSLVGTLIGTVAGAFFGWLVSRGGA